MAPFFLYNKQKSQGIHIHQSATVPLMMRSTIIAFVIAACIGAACSACPNACSGWSLCSEAGSGGPDLLRPRPGVLYKECVYCLQAMATAAQKNPIKISVSVMQLGWGMTALSVSTHLSQPACCFFAILVVQRLQPICKADAVANL